MRSSHILRFLLPQALLLLAMAEPALAQDSDADSLTAAIDQCDSCHAVEARVNSDAPVLDGLPRRYLEDQLENFISGKRGNDPTNQFTLTMLEQLRALDSDQAESIARRYSRRKETFSSETVTGNANHGEPLFEENCSGCHVSSMGRMFTKSPPIVHLEGPYIVSQLQAFATEQRGFASENEHKLKMAQVAGRLDEQDMRDITAYIKTRFAMQ